MCAEPNPWASLRPLPQTTLTSATTETDTRTTGLDSNLRGCQLGGARAVGTVVSGSPAVDIKHSDACVRPCRCHPCAHAELRSAGCDNTACAEASLSTVLSTDQRSSSVHEPLRVCESSVQDARAPPLADNTELVSDHTVHEQASLNYAWMVLVPTDKPAHDKRHN
jgi:hypothetical protein